MLYVVIINLDRRLLTIDTRRRQPMSDLSEQEA